MKRTDRPSWTKRSAVLAGGLAMAGLLAAPAPAMATPKPAPPPKVTFETHRYATPKGVLVTAQPMSGKARVFGPVTITTDFKQPTIVFFKPGQRITVGVGYPAHTLVGVDTARPGSPAGVFITKAPGLTVTFSFTQNDKTAKAVVPTWLPTDDSR